MKTIKYGLFILIPFILFVSYVSKAKKSSVIGKEAVSLMGEKNFSKPVITLLNGTAENSGCKWDLKDIPGFGTIPLPTGNGWIKYGDQVLGNRLLGCEVSLKSDAGNYSNRIKEYLDSYKEVNKKEIPGNKIIEQREGEINNITAVELTGSFDNGTKFVTRDIIFFKKDAVQIIQSRVKEENRQSLNKVLDYMAVNLK